LVNVARFRFYALSLALIAALWGCGRVGVRLLPQADPNPVGDDGGVCVADKCTRAMCTDPSSSPTEGICGCGGGQASDSDADGVPDCSDFCPGAPDQRDAVSCTCPAAAADADQDGVPNCLDRCPFDGLKTAPGMCGCGVVDADDDHDNTPNCRDECPDDPAKSQRGICGCGQSDQDTDLDGIADCEDRCSGRSDVMYSPDLSCGTGYCRTHNVPSTCVNGVETACSAGTPAASSDASCDGLDDDCDGLTDEDFSSTVTTCGLGVCAATGRTTCVSGAVVDSCAPAAAASASDATCDDRDDDCDGHSDEDVMPMASACAMGACATTGMIACVGGKLVDSCQASAPISPTDTTCNNTDDDCDGRVDEEYASAATSCGVGVCSRTGMRSCALGVVADSCVAGTRTSSSDTTCNGLDDDCDGHVDEEFAVSATSCGTGACASSGTRSCVSGAAVDSCTPKVPTTSVDDATSPGNGIDDDCDGRIDEDIPACDTTAKVYEAGAYNNLSVPGNCKNVSIRLWGGGGASGQSENTASGGSGGPGGYAAASALVAGAINLYVGGGAASGCNNPGTNAGAASYNGGSGGTSTGDNGADGMVSGGGTGGAPSPGSSGGNGYYGGGGGGEAGGNLSGSGDGGGGAAASVFSVNGVRVALAGGGGGGGGALYTLSGLIADNGGNGGSGCRGNGQVATANGGGGGGGGVCQGSTTQSGSGTTPAFSSSIPSGRAAGGAGSCAAGGGGYAILTFSP
jgi:hypothetical protein